MQKESGSKDEYVDSVVKRTLAVRALRQIRGLVDGYEAEDRRKRRLLKVYGFLIFALVVFTVFYIGSFTEDRELDKADRVIVPGITE